MKTITKTILIAMLAVIGWSGSVNAQQYIGTVIAPATPPPAPAHPSSMLDIRNALAGLLIPRLQLTSTTDTTTIPGSEISLLVYNLAPAGLSPNKVTAGFYYWSGTKWIALSGGSGGNDWALQGNAGTSAVTNFIGTTDAQPLKFKVGNLPAGSIESSNMTSNTFLGSMSGNNNTGINNCGYGYFSLTQNTGRDNTAIGMYALRYNTSGGYNTASGLGALLNNTTGDSNTASGSGALLNNTGGFNNTASGYQALTANTMGAYNAAVGYQALGNNTTGSNNTAIGYGANVLNYNLTNATAIGNGAVANTSNEVRIGNTDVTSLYFGTGNNNLATTTTSAPNMYYDNSTGQIMRSTATGGGASSHYLGEDFNGGIIFYLYKGSDGLEHGLIVSKTESAHVWQAVSTLTNANHTEDGAFNTPLMLNSNAANYIATLGIGWYLPSIDELMLLYNNRFTAQRGLRAGGYTLLSNLATYWSSMEHSINFAYNVGFDTGTANYNSKGGLNAVRGIRAF